MFLFSLNSKEFTPIKEASFSHSDELLIEEITIFNSGIFCTGAHDGKLKFWTFNLSFLKEFEFANYINSITLIGEGRLALG
jgi:hypothetical protein